MDLIRHGGSAALRESLHYARSMKKKALLPAGPRGVETDT